MKSTEDGVHYATQICKLNTKIKAKYDKDKGLMIPMTCYDYYSQDSELFYMAISKDVLREMLDDLEEKNE